MVEQWREQIQSIIIERDKCGSGSSGKVNEDQTGPLTLSPGTGLTDPMISLDTMDNGAFT